MEQETVTKEVVIEKVRQRLGALYGNAEQAVVEAIAIINEPRQTPSPKAEEPFVSTNVSVAQYVAWSPEERFQYLNNAEKVNARWVERQFQKLNAAWMMVIDGQVVSYDADFQNLLRTQEFNALCQKYNGKYPFVFFHPKNFMIEEITAWHASPFVSINPDRTALVSRRLSHKLAPIVHLDFAARQTEIEFRSSVGT